MKEDENTSLRVKKSIIPAIIYMLYTEIFLVVGFLAIYIFGIYLSVVFLASFSLFIIAGLVLVVANLALFVFLYNWINTYYIIEDESVVHIRNHLTKKSESFYSINENSDFKLKQGYLGKIYNFGSIKIMGPTIDKPINLLQIERPDVVLEHLVTMISDINSGDVIVNS